jgi:orotidine 5'-phosphate decarboxylase subfamily 1
VLLTVHEILNTLERKKLITQTTVSNVCKYIEDNHISNLELMTAESKIEKNRRLSYNVRLSALRNPLAREVFKLMYEKKTNVALSLDVPNKKLFLSILKQVAPHICMLKTHINIIDDFDEDFIKEIRSLQSKFKFFIMEDGKFCDIGNTLQYQLTGGIYKINNWANSVTAHGISGKSIMGVYEKINKNATSRGLVLVAEMSNKHNLISKEYTDAVIDMVSNHSANNVMGFVSQQKIAGDEYLYLTPGVGLLSGEDNLDQRYKTPEKAIREDCCDIIIVGRAIYNSDDPLGAIIELKQRSWDSLLF